MRLDGRDVLALSIPELRAIRGRDAAMIFQEPMTSLNPVQTAGVQVVEAIRLHEAVSKAAARRRTVELFERVGIPDPDARFDAYPHQLSGGMKQRVMIAMALSSQPKLLIADEPTTALDVTIQAQILELLRELQRDSGMGILLITHDLGIVNELADRVAVMYAAGLVEEGTRETILGGSASLHAWVALLDARAGAARGTPDRDFRYGARAGGLAARLPLLLALHAGHRDLPDRAARRARAGRRPRGALPRGQARGAVVSAPEALLRVQELRTWFPIRRGILQRTVGWVRAVDDVSFEVPAGRTLALVGESGCGKTTAGLSILRLVEPSAGRVLFDGEDLLALSDEDMRARRHALQIVFQDPLGSLNPRMRVRDAIAEGMRSFSLGASESERTDRVAALLERVQLDPRQMWRYPHEFSGGQRQRICIARALAVEPRLVICDEAVSALDVSIQAQILNLLGELQQDLGLTYLFITHDLSVVRYLADEVAVMYLGQIVEHGETERIFQDPRHPYTRGLLAAVPSVDPRRRSAAARVLGDVPSPANPPSGCRFHTRCPEAFDRCDKEAPELYPVEGGRSRCFLSE